jgi:hypothetical protein
VAKPGARPAAARSRFVLQVADNCIPLLPIGALHS